ncbi:MAG: hypothetical protein AAF513_02550 [Pseudomonadota bacterium]
MHIDLRRNTRDAALVLYRILNRRQERRIRMWGMTTRGGAGESAAPVARTSGCPDGPGV